MNNGLLLFFGIFLSLGGSFWALLLAPGLPLLGALAGAALALMAGWWGLREVLRRPVVETLRKATA